MNLALQVIKINSSVAIIKIFKKTDMVRYITYRFFVVVRVKTKHVHRTRRNV